MPDRGRVHFDLGNRQATLYREGASDIDVVVRLLYLVEVISAKPTKAKIATAATTTISFRKNPGYVDRRGELFTGGRGNPADDDADRYDRAGESQDQNDCQ